MKVYVVASWDDASNYEVIGVAATLESGHDLANKHPRAHRAFTEVISFDLIGDGCDYQPVPNDFKMVPRSSSRWAGLLPSPPAP